jgi:hypothetical protein
MLVGVSFTSHAACNIIDGKAYGDCEGVNLNVVSPQRLAVHSKAIESGIISGATIFQGGDLEFRGLAMGDIIVHKGGRLLVSGIVNATVTNLGGRVEIEGMVDHVHAERGEVIIGGNVSGVSGGGTVKYKKGAVIGGIPRN